MLHQTMRSERKVFCFRNTEADTRPYSTSRSRFIDHSSVLVDPDHLDAELVGDRPSIFSNAALRRFVDDLTLRAVAARAGVTVQTVLRKFGSRSSLLETAIRAGEDASWLPAGAC